MKITKGVGRDDSAYQKSSTCRSCGPYATLARVGIGRDALAATADWLTVVIFPSVSPAWAQPENAPKQASSTTDLEGMAGELRDAVG